MNKENQLCAKSMIPVISIGSRNIKFGPNLQLTNGFLITNRYDYLVDTTNLELEVLDPKITAKICADQCGAKCCNFAMNDYSVKLIMEDYKRLAENGLDQFVTFVPRDKEPQLINKPNGDCIFLDPDKKQCSIYYIRPIACRAYPYRVARDEVPKWCILFHSSTDELINQEEKKADHLYEIDYLAKYDEIPEEYVEYLEREESKSDNIKELVTHFASVNGANEIWSIFVSDKKFLKEAKKKIIELKNQYTEMPWYVVSMRFYSGDLEFMYQLSGVFRHNFDTDVPYFDKFPPSKDKYMTLLSLAENTKKWKAHLIAGVEFPESVYPKLQEKFS